MLARKEEDELTLHKMTEMLNNQVKACNDTEELLQKARAYNSLPGLFYHLDYELGKKAKKKNK